MRIPRWVIPLPAIFFSFFPISAKAEPILGLNAVGYIVSATPPIKSDTEYPTCGSEIENNINRNFDYELFQQCPSDMFMVHYTGYITIPANSTIKFMVAADDGGTVKIGTTEFGTWNLKGCLWSAQTTNTFEAGIYPLDGWYYEWGGNACYMLAWNINNTGWVMVPDSAFTTSSSPTTTTSSTTTTTSSTTSTSTTTTTTTLPPTTTTSSTTTLPQETTTTTEPVQSSTTTSTTSTTTSTTTTVAPTPTTTQAPYTPPQTTTTTELPVTTTSSTTTTTSLPEPSTTVEETSTTSPSTTTSTTTTEPATTTTTEPATTTTEPATTTSTTYPVGLPEDTVERDKEPVEPDETTIPLPTVLDEPDDSFPSETVPQIEQEEQTEETLNTVSAEEEFSSETTIPLETVAEDVLEDIENQQIINDELFEEILDVLESESVSAEQIVEVVTALLKTELSQEQVFSIASSPQVMQNVTSEEAEQIFAEVVEEELTEEQGAEIVEAVQSAPTEIRKSFEKKINVFSGVFDTYVPTGSTITVAERRILNGVTAILFVLPAPIAVSASSRRE